MKTLRQSIEAAVLLFIALFLGVLPRRWSLGIGAALGALIYRLGIRTAVAKQNLRGAFPDWNAAQIERIARKCYRHYGAVLVEFIRLWRLNAQNVFRLVDISGRELLDEALAAGRGGIVVSGHFGNWELMGAAAAVLGYPVTYIVTSQENELIDRLMNAIRRRHGVEIMHRRNAKKGILRALDEGRFIAILADQDAHERGVFVPFFDKLASTPRGAALYTLRTQASLIFGESYRQGSGKLQVILRRVPVEDLPEDPEAALVELTCRFTAMLEAAVRCHPEQWFWMHRRWKTAPPAELLPK